VIRFALNCPHHHLNLRILRVEGRDHKVELVHGEISGKKRIYVDNVLVHESMTFIDEGIVQTLPAHIFEPLCVSLVIDTKLENWVYDLRVNGELLDDIEKRRKANQEDGGMELAAWPGLGAACCQ
jgi:hypothetical protein